MHGFIISNSYSTKVFACCLLWGINALIDSFINNNLCLIAFSSLTDKEEMRAAIQKRQPHKIDIGAVFSAHPSEHTSLSPEKFKTVERELVFDVDMTDYDVVRTCCSGASICRKCWPFMTMALKCVDVALREDFAFKHILWVYSGRRGVHCWVSDADARALSNEARTAVVKYLSLELEGKDDRLSRQVQTPLHPHLQRSYDLLEPYFARDICGDEGQGLLTHSHKAEYTKLLNTIPDEFEDVRTRVYKLWEDKSLTGTERWEILKEEITTGSALNNNKRKLGSSSKDFQRKMDAWRYKLVFSYTYPRLDANVSIAQNHLLKSPFCVHPKTGRVCIPIDPLKADDFDPFTVPTVRTLCAQIDEYDRKNPNKATLTADVDKTAMKAAVELFDRSFMNGLNTEIKKGFRNLAEERSAMQVDF